MKHMIGFPFYFQVFALRPILVGFLQKWAYENCIKMRMLVTESKQNG